MKKADASPTTVDLCPVHSNKLMIIVKCPHVKMTNGTDVQKYYDELIEMLDLTCLVCEEGG